MRRGRSLACLSGLVLAALSPAQGTLLARGQAALAAGRHEEALQQGRAFVAKAPTRYEGHRLVGRALLGLDRPDPAEAALRRALALAPAAAAPTLRDDLREVASLRVALREVARAKGLRAAGDPLAAARAEEAAYRALPARPGYGLLAADLYEAANRPDDARRVLQAVQTRSPAAGAALRLAVLDANTEADRRKATEALRSRLAEQARADDERREAERQARERAAQEKEVARQRAEEERQRAEEERQRAERQRLDREETDRLNGVLDGFRRDASSAESAVRDAEGRASDLDRDVQKLDHEADDARGRRDRAKGERDRAQSALDDAKGDLARQVAQTALRGAENAYNDAKGEAERADRRRDDAKSRRDAARSDLDAARARRETAKAGIRDTEAAIARIASGD